MAPWSHTVGSDGILVGDRPHPRSYGTFPRYFAVYVRELGILTLGAGGAQDDVAAGAAARLPRPRAARPGWPPT